MPRDNERLCVTLVWLSCGVGFVCSIGWSVGATLGYSLAAASAGKRLVSFIGDGSFQVSAVGT